MSDPTIQTFCCHHGNGTDVAVTIAKEFDTNSYNMVCLFCSGLGILGALYQVLPRRQFANSHRWLSFSAERGRRIIVWLALADLLAAVGVFTRSMIWMNKKNIMPAIEDDSSVMFCAISSAFIQYFYTSTWIWTLCYSIDMRYILSQEEGHFKYYHLSAWLIPAILTVTGLSLLYIPNADCHTSVSLRIALQRILPNYIITYLPIVVVMLANPILYKHSIKDMKTMITCTSGQFTSRERDILEAIKIKFAVINVVFYVCWLPNLINGFLLWILWFHLPARSLILLWYLMAFTNPLQAFFNAMVYRRWSAGSEKLVLPWKHYENPYCQLTNSITSSNTSRETIREEIYPLLQNAPSKSINGCKSLP
ncbi:G-protein coupled receptor 143-like isoform X1 [Euwallacea fornicatus]|uniref:G-protein coupled receptor 143-like isoform X1 n=1 Tax=Euwallacea fornicatus TaxID=995702 RepID=UPI00338DAF58